MVKVAGNLNELISSAANEYIELNAYMFKSTTPGPEGQRGPAGPQGVGVHHMKGTSTTDSEGDFGTAGETDTYTFYADANEEFPLAWFSIKNGEDSYKNATNVGYAGTEYEFYKALGDIESNVEISVEAVGLVEADRQEVAMNTLMVAEYHAEVILAKDAAEAASVLAVDSADMIQMVFLGAKSSDPLTDNEGNPLVEGVMYYNTVGKTLRIWNGVEWNLGAFSIAGAVATFNGRDGNVILNNADVTAAVGTDLSTVEYGATADQTGDEIQVLYEGQPNKVLTDVNVVDFGDGSGPGEVSWNSEEKTLDLVMTSDVVCQVGQEMLARVRNSTGSTIANGTVVMATGAVGASGNITVAPHDGTRGNGKKVVGLATHDILNGEDGMITVTGKVRGFNTTGSQVGETWNLGDVLYIKPNDDGNLTKITPSDSELYMPIAMVVNVHSKNGTLLVRTTGIDENAFKDWVNDKFAVTEW